MINLINPFGRHFCRPCDRRHIVAEMAGEEMSPTHLGQSHCIQNKQLMIQDIIEILKNEIQTRAHQNGIHM